MTEEKVDTSHSGGTSGYRVEAMHDYRDPITIGDQIFTREWKTVHFAQGTCGVPIGPAFEAPWLATTDCVSYASAQALRWWLHASAGRDGVGSLCLRSRLVKYEIKFSVSAVRRSEHCEIGGDDRSNSFPDWGSKK